MDKDAAERLRHREGAAPGPDRASTTSSTTGPSIWPGPTTSSHGKVLETRRSEDYLQSTLDRMERLPRGHVQGHGHDPRAAGPLHGRAPAPGSPGWPWPSPSEMNLPWEKIEGSGSPASSTTSARSRRPAEIMAKPGRLTKSEFQLVKDHPRVGYEIDQGHRLPLAGGPHHPPAPRAAGRLGLSRRARRRRHPARGPDPGRGRRRRSRLLAAALPPGPRPREGARGGPQGPGLPLRHPRRRRLRQGSSATGGSPSARTIRRPCTRTAPRDPVPSLT
ncbi:MAG: hypothetical protein MZV64_63320 [Ignavibacteriales bacterium]|nr:hypothetical protein [Ignavibacteriales bacterium]